MKPDKKELLAGEKALLNTLKVILENRIVNWSSEGHIDENYVQYKVHNGLFSYHVNKERRPFALSSQRYCAEQSWGPSGQLDYYNGIDIALEAIKKGADLNEQDDEGNTALMLACAIGEPRLIKPILAETKDVLISNKNGETALHFIARSGREDGAKLFLKKEFVPDINLTDNAGWTALDIARAKSRKEILPLLDTDKTDFTPAEIREAALDGKISIVEKYLQNGGDAELIDPDDSASILIDVARNDRGLDTTAEMVKLLLKHGADVNAVQSNGFNALMMCVNSLHKKGPRIPAFDGEYMEHVKIAKILIDNGIDLTQAKNGSMQKVLRDAAEVSPEITKMIVDKLKTSSRLKEELDYQDSDGFTAMHTAVRAGKIETIRCLVEAGANINIAEDYGFIPLHEAIIGGNYENAKYLIENGADVNHKIIRADGAYAPGDDAKAIASKSRNQDILNLF